MRGQKIGKRIAQKGKTNTKQGKRRAKRIFLGQNIGKRTAQKGKFGGKEGQGKAQNVK